MSITGIVLVFTSSEGNLVTPLLGTFAAGIGIFYFRAFNKNIVGDLSNQLALLKPKQKYIRIFISYFYTDTESFNNAIKKEKEAEEQRSAKFEIAFPRLNRTPIVGSIFKLMYKEGFKYSLGLVMILLLSSVLLFYNLGERDLWEDEHQVVSAAAGYLYTDDFYRWDWVRDDVVCLEDERRCQYDRAWPHTWLIAQSYKIFGVSEWSSRVVSVLFGIFLVFLSYYFTKFFIEDKRIALFAAFLFSINPSYIKIGRYTRMYALLLPLFLILVYAFYKGMGEKTNLDFIKWQKIKNFIKENFNYNYPYLFLGFALLLFVYHIHINGMVILPVLLLFAFYMAILSKEKKYIVLALIGFILSTITVILGTSTSLLNKMTNFLSFFQRNNQIYLDYITRYPLSGKISIVILLLGLLSLALMSNKRIRNKLAYLYAIVIFSLIFFIYIADRYASFVYISHVSAISLVLITYFYLSIILRLRSRLVKSILIIFLIASSVQYLWLDAGSLYKNDNKLGNFSVAYKTIIDNYDSDNDVIFGQYLRDYYLDDVDSRTKIISMLNNRRYQFTTFLIDINKYESGWITWESRKGYHISQEIREYINANFQKVHGYDVDDTKVEVYYYDQTMIPSVEQSIEDNPNDATVL